MDHIFSLLRKPSKIINILKQVFSVNSHCISISSKNVVAFSTEIDIDDSTSRAWGSHVYIADLNCPWFVHKILSNSVSVSVLQWDFVGDLLLVGDENGTVRIYKTKDHLLNDWTLVLQTVLLGEHILAAAFFHCGVKINLNLEKKDSASYLEKFQHVKFSSSVRQFGGHPANGVLVLTVTGMLGAILLPQPISQTPMIVATESLGSSRVFIKTADICYGKNGHFLLAVNSGNIISPVQCYKVQVRKVEEKCVITSQSVPSFFLFEGGKDTMNPRSEVTCLKWVLREDADSLVVTANNDNGSCLQIWELREKSLPVHKLLCGNETQYFNTVLWQYQSNFQYNHKLVSIATSKLTILNSMSCGYIVAAFADNSLHCLYRDSLKVISSTTINLNYRPGDDHSSKYLKLNTKIKQIDMSWLGHLLLVIDTEGHLHLFKLPPQIESSTPLTVPYVTTMLEYCLVTGLDWLDLLLAMRPGMLDALCERFTESFSRQTPAVQQFYYNQYLNIKISLYRLSNQGTSKVNDLTHLLMLNSISTAFKSLLRPSEVSSHDKSPADSLANVIAEGQSDVDKVLMHLEAKEFTVEPSALQSLQQLIQWVADLALNLLARLPDSRPSVGKPYEILRDVKAINTLRELLVLIRIWGLLRPACWPVFTKSDNSLDVLALLFRLLSRLVQNINEPDESLIDECCLLPSQVQIQQLQPSCNNRVALACPQLSQQILPLHLEFQTEPECLSNVTDSINNQWVDSIRHIYLGNKPRVVKQCVRCGGTAAITPCTRTAAIRAWNQRWLRTCRCGGLWRIHTYT
ncbi:mediator of RNA polymerase II transcription subunit 16 isoform X2 [Agrilus planipennis]|uniref:Mediator of RNA polymerase II transcription subunit 16 n=1 Tax=Agrilus planipennis TaxID=224129 RepID=A0A7F5QY65_AGRPL|nr:mediator of RNA polymerase II transcription subunit 16 isoform X2 [Agrilus planipennis]